MVNNSDVLKNNITLIREAISEAASKSNRKAESINLHAATKGVTPENIFHAVQFGITEIGENWVQEAKPKTAILSELVEASQFDMPRLHMIGHLQSNKAREALTVFDSIDTLDSKEIAERMNRILGENETKIQTFIEIDLTGDPNRNGFRLQLEQGTDSYSNFLESIDAISKLKNIELTGLMTVPPITNNPEDARPYFSKAKSIFDNLKTQFPNHPFTDLSMGMTNDYHIAIEEGATIIRLGTAIFGKRPAGRTY
jgi:pyridoxal phosphate enzyme (YggS family)